MLARLFTRRQNFTLKDFLPSWYHQPPTDDELLSRFKQLIGGDTPRRPSVTSSSPSRPRRRSSSRR